MLDSSLLVVTGILALIVILANVAEQRIELRPLLYVALAAINVTVVLSTQEAFGAEAALIALGLMLLATLPLLRHCVGYLCGCCHRASSSAMEVGWASIPKRPPMSPPSSSAFTWSQTPC